MSFGRQDAIIATTLLAVATGTFFAMSLMSGSAHSLADQISVYSTLILGQIIQEEDVVEVSEEETVTEEKTPAAFPLDILTTTDTAKVPAKLKDIPSLPVQSFSETNQSSSASVLSAQPPTTNQSTSQTTSVTYSSGGGGGGGGSSHKDKSDDEKDDQGSDEKDKPESKPDPKPEPDPAPKPDPKPEPDDDPTETKGLHGVNFIDPVLNRKERKAKLSEQTDFVDEFVQIAKKSEFNLFRIPVKWEAYVGNEDNFLAELDYIVKTANENKISVWIDFHHFHATSQWGKKVAKGEGFPKFVVSCYKPTKQYESDPEVRAFWNDYYLNKVRDSSNKCKGTIDVWTLHADFMKDMIREIDHYPNVIGYELLNEPHVWKDADYENLGIMHTEIAKMLRKVTDKTIIFTRESPRGLEPGEDEYTRKPDLQYKILPKVDGKIMYSPHVYGLDNIERHVENWKEDQKKWSSMGYDVEIGVGEWATQPPQLKKGKAVTQENINDFVRVWSREGYMHTYWAFGCFSCGEGNVLVKKNGDLDHAGEFYIKSIIKHYGVN